MLLNKIENGLGGVSKGIRCMLRFPQRGEQMLHCEDTFI